MKTRSEVLECVRNAIDRFNEEAPADKNIEFSVDAALFGHSGALDSLSLVNLIVLIEQTVEDTLGIAVSLADEKALSMKRSPFATVGTVIDYLQRLIQEKSND